MEVRVANERIQIALNEYIYADSVLGPLLENHVFANGRVNELILIQRPINKQKLQARNKVSRRVTVHCDVVFGVDES